MPPPTTGRYETRQELEDTIRHLWFDTAAKQSQIARIVRVSAATVASIIDSFTTAKEKPQ